MRHSAIATSCHAVVRLIPPRQRCCCSRSLGQPEPLPEGPLELISLHAFYLLAPLPPSSSICIFWEPGFTVTLFFGNNLHRPVDDVVTEEIPRLLDIVREISESRKAIVIFACIQLIFMAVVKLQLLLLYSRIDITPHWVLLLGGSHVFWKPFPIVCEMSLPLELYAFSCRPPTRHFA